MKLRQFQASAKITWQNNKPFALLIISLVAILAVLKILFYNYNYALLFNDAAAVSKFKMTGWSLLYDLLIVLLINIPFLFLLQLGRWLPAKISSWFIIPLFMLLNGFVLLLNLVDIFYFRFHFQRANADLLFVLDHPLKEFFHLNIFIIAGLFILFAACFIITWKLLRHFYRSFASGKYCKTVTAISFVLIIAALVFKNSFSKLLVPTYPLVSLNSKEILVVENSFHTFSYSLFRSGQEIPLKNYFSTEECDAVFPLKKSLTNADTVKKNIVLFIMESVPYDFFDTGSRYKVAMPFFDSLLQKSTLFTHAFSYSLNSNKGITAVLAGTPTLTEIPLYHSQYVSIPITPVGTALKAKGYHSFFCIGDDYDNFGFAKCTNWLGIEKYYCRDDMTAYKDKPSHTMGIHDEYVLDFMGKKINEEQQPFFAVNYNVSTHYPFDLPPTYNKFPAGYSTPMKTMSYYDHSLQQFFDHAKNEQWFQHTVFIFCSDHWQVPTEDDPSFDNVNDFHIPIIIYDPSTAKKIIDTSMVSQFDVLGTILSIGGYKDSIISYGGNLLDSAAKANSKVVFSKVNSTLYQVMNSSYALGYNIVTDKAEYLYHYTSDKSLKINLLNTTDNAVQQQYLMRMIRAFIQKATMQYHHQVFK
jgi:phosphoglycerol transferase MdoB-like AlkP superfamily enzyme